MNFEFDNARVMWGIRKPDDGAVMHAFSEAHAREAAEKNRCQVIRWFEYTTAPEVVRDFSASQIGPGRPATFDVNSAFARHVDVEQCSRLAVGTWLALGCQVAKARNLDGLVPAAALATVHDSVIDELVEHGLLRREGPLLYLDHGTHRLGELWRVKVDDRRVKIPDELKTTVFERDGWKCRNCGSTQDLTIDHVFPWSRGGLDVFDNLQTLCRICNSSKGARI